MKAIVSISMVAACAVLAVSSFAQQGQGRRRGGGFGRGGNQYSITSLIRRPDVQADLQLTDEEKTKLDAFVASQRGRRGRRGQGADPNAGQPGTTPAGTPATGTPPAGTATGQTGAGAPPPGGTIDPQARAQAARVRRDAEHKQLEAILTADQLKRLDEISIQMQGDQAILSSDVRKQLNFTKDQDAKVKSIQSKYQDAMQTVFTRLRNNEIDHTTAQTAMQTNQKVLGDELHKILTSAQVDQLKALGGKPFQRDPAFDNMRRRGG